MKNIVILIEILKIVETQRLGKVALVFFLIVLGSMLEIVSLGLVIPFLSVLENKENLPAWLAQILVPYSDESTNLMLAALFLLSFGVTTLMKIGILQTLIKYSFSLGSKISVRIISAFLSKSYEKTLSINSADILNAVAVKVNTVVVQAIVPLLTGLAGLIMLLGLFCFLLYFEPLITIIGIGGLISIYVIIGYTISRTLHRNGQIVAKISTLALKKAKEAVGAVREINLSGKTDSYVHSYSLSDSEFRTMQGANSILAQVPRYIVEFALVFALISFLALEYVKQAETDTITVLVVLGLSAQRLMPLAQQIFGGWSAIRGATEVIKEVHLLMSVDDTYVPAGQSVDFHSSFEIRDGGFRYYASENYIFDKVNIIVRKGDKIGVVGSTGSGKSTLIDIFLGLLPLSQGLIFIDGEEVSSLGSSNWKQLISHVPQHPFLFDATIAENIALTEIGNSYDEDRLRRAIEMAQLKAFVENLSDGVHSRIGEQGSRLSGGERQRIGIARAFYAEREIIVFDEATSALDADTEKRILMLFETSLKHTTSVFISHKPSSLSFCDAIYTVLNKQVYLR